MLICGECREKIETRPEYDDRGRPLHPSCKVAKDAEMAEVRRQFWGRAQRISRGGGGFEKKPPLYFAGNKK